jgi:putative inorganic carbon (HCO3(-)) transporter
MGNLRLNRVTVVFRQIAIFCDRWQWVLLALAAPFLLFPSPSRSLALFVVPGLWIVAWLVGREPLPRTPLNATLLLMFFMVLVSLWVTYDITISLPKVSGIVLGFGVFFAVAREAERPRGWILSLLAFLGIGLGIAALGVFGTSWFTSKITLFDPIIARLPKLIMGLQGAESGFHPNEVAGALIWVLPLMMAINVALVFLWLPPKNEDARALRKDWQEKMRGRRLVGVTILCLAATFFVAAVFLLSQSRGGYIGLALTLTALILIALPRRWRWCSLIALVVLAIVLGFLVASRWEAARTWVTGSNLAADPALSLNTLEGRLEVWSRAIYGIQDFPFTGMGMNAFRKVVPVLYPLFNISPEVDIAHAHNEFLQAALDLGIPGLVAFLALYIGAFWMLADVWRVTHHPALNNGHWSLVTRSLALGLGGGLLAHLLYGLTDAVALGAKPGVLFWMLLGLITGLRWQAQEHWAVVYGNVPTTGAENGLGK